MELQSFLKSKIVIAILGLALVSIAYITFGLYMQKREVDSEVARLQEQAAKLNTENKQISELIKYMDTPEYKEREAREKLNLKRPGEEVVVLPSGNPAGSVAGAQEAPKSNPEKWFAYFFKK